MIHLTRRSTLAVLGGALAAPYVRRAHAAEEPVLNVYNWADYIGETTIADFEARTGISVNYDVYSSTEEMQAKMLAGMTGYDVVNVAGIDMPRFLEPKLLLPLDRAKLPAGRTSTPRSCASSTPGTRATPTASPTCGARSASPTTWTMVRERLPDADLSSLDVLMKPENAEKLADCGISMLDSPQDIIPMVLAYLGKDGRAANPADYPAAVEALQQMRPFFATFDNANYINAMPNGELCAVDELVGRLRHRRRPRRRGRRRHRPRLLRARDRRPGLGRLHVDPGRRAAPGERPRLPRLPAGARGDRRLHQLRELRQRQRRLEALRRPGDPRATRRSTPTRRR